MGFFWDHDNAMDANGVVTPNTPTRVNATFLRCLRQKFLCDLVAIAQVPDARRGIILGENVSGWRWNFFSPTFWRGKKLHQYQYRYFIWLVPLPYSR